MTTMAKAIAMVLAAVLATGVAVWVWIGAARDTAEDPDRPVAPTQSGGPTVPSVPGSEPTSPGKSSEPGATEKPEPAVQGQTMSDQDINAWSAGLITMADDGWPPQAEQREAAAVAARMLSVLWTFSACADEGPTSPQEAAVLAGGLFATPALTDEMVAVGPGSAWEGKVRLCAIYTGPEAGASDWSIVPGLEHSATTITLAGAYNVAYTGGAVQVDKLFGGPAVFYVTLQKTPTGWRAVSIPDAGMDLLPARIIG